MKIDLTEREIPDQGEQPGVFADVVKGVKVDKRGKSHEMLTIVGQLASTKSNGKRFTATASYNLNDNRGVARLKDDLKVWRGSDALPDLSQFDPEAEFIGKAFLSEPEVTDHKGKKLIRIKGFKPCPDQIPVSPDFVRASQAPATT